MTRELSGDNGLTRRFRISVLGTSRFRDQDDQRVESVLQQPRRFALLVYLALESRAGPIRRDTVLGVFWPDKPQGKARGSLNQAIHYLRRSLGPGAIRTTADLLEVNREVVSCDAAEFLDAFDEDRWADAAAFFGGELLPGFFDSGSSLDFEHWLEKARRNIREAASRCAWALAEESEARRDSSGAEVWARRGCEWSQFEEPQVRRLMKMLDRLGSRSGVLEVFQALRRSLETLGTTPDQETRELLAELREGWNREGGDRLEPELGEDRPGQGTPSLSGLNPTDESPGAPENRGEGPADPYTPERRTATGRRWWSRPLREVASVAVTASIMVGFLSFWGLTRGPRPVATQQTTVLIPSLVADGGDAALAEMLRTDVVAQLQDMSGLRVVTESDGNDVVRERGFVVEGNLLGMGDSIRGSFRLVDGESGTALAATTVQGTPSAAPGALDGMARSVAQFIRMEVGTALDHRRLVEADVPQPAITAAVLGQQDMKLGASLFEDRSEEAARAAYRKADSMLAEAALLAPHWDRPWTDRAETAYRLMWIERQGGGGGPEVQRELAERGLQFADEAIARDRFQAESLELRALLNEWLWLLSQPDPSGQATESLAEAEADARRATELDPYRARAWNVLGATLLYRGEWADAYWALGRAIAADTHLKDNTEIILRLFSAAWESGNSDGAQAWCSLLQERLGNGWPVVNCQMYLLADSDNPDLQKVSELRRQARQLPYWSSIAAQFDALAAVLHARAGDPEGARAILTGISDSSADTELPYLEAWALLELGEVQEARGRIAEYVANYPAARQSLLESRRLRGLEGQQ